MSERDLVNWSNYMIFSLRRAESGTLLDEGGFTIVKSNALEHIDGYEVSDGAKTLTSSASSVPNGKAVVVRGTTYDSSAGHWVVPCDLFRILDWSLGESGQYDAVAGDVFLQNIYTVSCIGSFDFGDYTDSSKLTMGGPYVKLLPTTNISRVSKSAR
ncbi:uncharacterized protein EI90DRAFT_3025262 [Cantharellus anzutake]|uniref:uncharacterized protein n=1 Tax=Cantharellus anzutake TaxID=1750568 RepID=UPI001903A638|nr:uncharacterized protein EI90DRAFT_3025262 [Cantharellus anzutake]KAF8309250.1 hypothetical protein EI90DRAFT_3025262 [Cantharellus anzutake]